MERRKRPGCRSRTRRARMSGEFAVRILVLLGVRLVGIASARRDRRSG